MISWTLVAALLSACSSAPPVVLAANDCASLVPEEWAAGVPSAPLPPDKTAGAWVAFAVDQTGQLTLANGRTRDSLGIVKNCEARDRAVAESLKPKPWWHIW